MARSLPHIALLAIDNCYASSLYGLMDTLQIANAHIRNKFGEEAPQYTWEVVSTRKSAINGAGGIKLAADRSIRDGGHFDIIFVPAVYYAGSRDFEVWLEQQNSVCDWLKAQWQLGAVLVSNCTSTFLLAETGLLDLRAATTTWWLEKQFRQRYPRPRLSVKELITEEDNLICTGAISSYLYLGIYLLEKYSSPEIASLCAKAMLIDPGHRLQTPHQNLMDTPMSSDPAVSKAQYWLQTRLENRIDMSELASYLNLSQRTLIRKFKRELGLPPATYLQNIRMETAKQLLESTRLPISEIAEKVGYANIGSFSRLFQDRIGLTPNRYRQRFSMRGINEQTS